MLKRIFWSMVGLSTLLTPALAFAAPELDCDDGKSLEKAVRLSRPGAVIHFRGTCREAITITKALTLVGLDGAAIDGAGLTLDEATGLLEVAARGVSLESLTVRNSPSVGISLVEDAYVEASNVVAEWNATAGIAVAASQLALSDVTSRNNGAQGVFSFGTSNLEVRGNLTAQDNGATGVQVGSGSVGFRAGETLLINNASGLLIATGRAGITGASVTVQSSQGIGVNVFNGAALLVAEGALTVSDNGSFGLSVLGGDVAVLEPATLSVTGNGATGINASQQSQLLILATQDGPFTVNGTGQPGLAIDHSSLRVVATPGDAAVANTGLLTMVAHGADVLMSNVDLGEQISLNFGSGVRLFGSAPLIVSCDGTVLTQGFVCTNQ
jgi:nitrous oxidase accessory protein NosD